MRSGSSFGVITKYCELPESDERKSSCIALRSNSADMPWLISSTTRKDDTACACIAMQNIMIAIAFSPPELRAP